MSADQSTIEQLAAVLRSFVAMCPSNEGLGGRAPIGAFLNLAPAAREALARYDAERAHGHHHYQSQQDRAVCGCVDNGECL